MLKGISPVLSPDLLKLLSEMGHGDELVLADANFPGVSVAARLCRADGLSVSTLLDAILPLFPLDVYADPLIMMQAAGADQLDPAVESGYLHVMRRHQPDAPKPLLLERSAFYDRSREAFAVVMTGELRIYGNIILKKGVIV
ncbi:L-fucose mutarotase [Granulicella sp. L46]|uniref:L-fucose mutarotase n=1 Tax=Granulicella sp. L46 TaxID=1641865 RepID=UPI00131B2487|nr:L-fucose mutarotase [Granulicella sp. L46]